MPPKRRRELDSVEHNLNFFQHQLASWADNHVLIESSRRSDRGGRFRRDREIEAAVLGAQCLYSLRLTALGIGVPSMTEIWTLALLGGVAILLLSSQGAPSSLPAAESAAI